MKPDRPLKVDFGFFVTLGLAGRVYGAAFFRLVAWALFSTISALLICLLPILLGIANYHRYPSDSWQALLSGSIAVLAMLALIVLAVLVFTPAGCVVLCDQSLREERTTFTEAMGRAVASVATHAGSLGALCLVFLFLLALFVLPGLVLFYLLFEQSPIGAQLALLGFFGIGCLFLLVTSMLAVPALLLEEEGASKALIRSWELSTSGAPTLAGLGAVFLGALFMASLPGEIAVLAPVAFVVQQVVALFLPALMVAAYHGLVSEDAHVLGRG